MENPENSCWIGFKMEIFFLSLSVLAGPSNLFVAVILLYFLKSAGSPVTRFVSFERRINPNSESRDAARGECRLRPSNTVSCELASRSGLPARLTELRLCFV